MTPTKLGQGLRTPVYQDSNRTSIIKNCSEARSCIDWLVALGVETAWKLAEIALRSVPKRLVRRWRAS